jgi:hypothetical protein
MVIGYEWNYENRGLKKHHNFLNLGLHVCENMGNKTKMVKANNKV